MFTSVSRAKQVFILISIIFCGKLLVSIYTYEPVCYLQNQPHSLEYAEREVQRFSDQASSDPLTLSRVSSLSSINTGPVELSSTEEENEERTTGDAETHPSLANRPKKQSSGEEEEDGVSKETKPSKDGKNSKLSHKTVVANITDSDALETSPYSTCSSVRFGAAGSLPMKALWSYPGSGNTWVRYLIERATGLYTGSVWCDRALERGGLLGECKRRNCGCVVVVKMHRFEDLRNSPWKGAILIIRNPYNAMEAEWNRKRGHSHNGTARDSLFKGEAWSTFVTKEAKTWRKVFDDAVAFFNKSLLIVHYEDLILDLIPQLHRIVDFLGINNTDTLDRINCTAAHSTGNFKRGKKGLSFDPYTPDLRSKVDAEINRVMNKMRRRGMTLPPYATDYVSSNNSTEQTV